MDKQCVPSNYCPSGKAENDSPNLVSKINDCNLMEADGFEQWL